MKPNRCQSEVDESKSSTIKLSPSHILLSNLHYVVIDKPYDVRMNGDFDVTVESLLLEAFPSRVAGSFKWIHQLDYATSGVLWYGT